VQAQAAPVSASTFAIAERTITVTSTGYSLPGNTATGLPVGYGVVAVDPSVIPLGTRLMIPGYGEGVAADTGSAVHGYTIDLWFPTLADARAWGRRTVTIILH
jgi:3D (Asp-Asp-Asp) domain-containing protein